MTGSLRIMRVTRSDVVVGMLIAMIVLTVVAPGLLVAREAARRSSCQNNLRQVALGLGLYAEVSGHLPMACDWSSEGYEIDEIYRPHSPFTNIYSAAPGTRADNVGDNWLISLLPYLPVKLVAAVDASNRGSLRQEAMPLFVCPTDAFADRANYYEWRLADGSRAVFARGNYALNLGPNCDCPVPGDSTSPCATGYHYVYDTDAGQFQLWGDGVSGINVTFEAAAFARGRSATVAVDEIRAGLHRYDPRGVWALGQIGASITFAHGMYGDACGPNNTGAHSDDIHECATITRVLGNPRLVEERMGCCPHCQGNKQATSRSMHPGGVNVLLLDGAAKFVRDDIDEQVWHMMHTR